MFTPFSAFAPPPGLRKPAQVLLPVPLVQIPLRSASRSSDARSPVPRSLAEFGSMRKLLSRLWNDDGGAIIAMEWVFIATILVLGIITGLVAVRQAVLTELSDVAQAILSLNQSYSFTGQSNCQASTAGSQFTVNP